MSTTVVASQSNDFDAWAQVYDEQPNPLLALEERFLKRMLPNLRGMNVVDVGCGTGRWLKLLATHSPSSLTGVDTSSVMLQRASIKLGSKAILHLSPCDSLPITDSTINFVLSSFVLSYLSDIDTFAEELNRVTHPGASIFITDMHPTTALICNWKRSYKAEGSEKEVSTNTYTLSQITTSFQKHGFELLSLIEPHFDAREKSIFEQNGRLHAYEAAASHPAIYILQLRKPPKSTHRYDQPPQFVLPLRLSGADYAVGPDAIASAVIDIDQGHIRSISSSLSLHRQDTSSEIIDLSGHLLLPGLVNSHDHLEFSLFPNLGSGPYQNSVEWAAEIHRIYASTIANHRRVPKPVRLAWGAIRNLLCGVTTVCHHNPLTRELLAPDFPVRVLAKFGWAHSLAMDPNLIHNYDHTPSNLPFILHAAEGIDSKSAQEIFDLDRMQVIDERAVLVHGLAFDKKAASLLNQRGSAVVICPTSNQFLFHCTPSSTLIHSLNTVVLGSDSPLTAAGDLLNEVHFSHREIGLDSTSLYEMVTSKPASVLRLRSGEGYLRPGSIADIVAVRQRGLSPAETLAQLTIDQIELVILAGRVQLASPTLYDRLSADIRNGLEPLEVNGHRRWIRAPISNLLAAAKKTLGNEIRLGGKRIDYANIA